MAGLSTVSDDWQSITYNDVITGLKYNTDFVSGGFEPVYFIGDKSIKSSYANDTIQNCTQILANLLRSNDNLTIKTFEATGENKYPVGKCSNIQYVARYIDSKIESITSTSVCDIPLDVSEKIGKYDTRFTSNGLGGQLVCRITSNDIEYLRAFTISGQEITLLDTVTGSVSAIASLAVDDRFELINAYDILEEGLEETTGYPVQGFVKKHVKPNEDTSFVEFGKYDTPAKLSGEKVVIAYNALDDYNQTFIYDGSIDQYGIFTKKEDLNFALTQSQLTFIETTLKKFIEPNIVIELETFRPSKPLKGWNVNVNIPEFDLVGIFKITRVSEVFISETGQLIDKPFRLWKVTLSNYENNLAQLLAGLKKKNDSKAKLATNQVLRTAMSLDLQFKWIDDPSEFTLDAPTAYDATNVTVDDFEANWSYVANANDYILFVARDAGFTIPVSGFAGLIVGNVTLRLVDDQDVTDNDTFYYKVKAINTDLNLESDWSNTITVNKVVGLKIDINFGLNSISDISGNSNNATLYGASLQSGGLQTGDTHHLLLDGTDDYARVNYNSSLDTASFTVEIIFSLVSIESFMPLVSRYETSVSDQSNAMFLIVYDTDRFYTALYDESYVFGSNLNFHQRKSTTANSLSINTKYVLQVAYDDVAKTFLMKLNNVTVATIYASGNMNTLASLNFNDSNNAPFLLGAFIDQYGANEGQTSWFPNMKIARSRYWTKALSDSELTDSYNEINT